MAPSLSPQRQVNESCLAPRCLAVCYASLCLAFTRMEKGRAGVGAEPSSPGCCLLCLRQRHSHGWRQSLVKDSACFLWCYLRICHSLWEASSARSDSSFGVLTPHVYVIEKRKNKFSCFISPQQAFHASEVLAELGCALPWRGSRRKPLHTSSSSSSHETPSPALSQHRCPGHC